ncbi:antifreeze protein [Mycena alexandri]|uniref:Antifreeze protein n=1 Tax=Mycena alexandri TaxID=1745969 RepID=A0AAD6THW7_9AGAR|nr:antifreeze protein [Mycena alexandri]
MISSVFVALTFLTAVVTVGAVGPASVDLGTAGNYAIIGETGITTVPPSVITGSMAVSPIDATAITGFSLSLDPTGQFSTSTQVSGQIFAASYSVPTPATLTTAIGDMVTAYNDSISRTNPDFLNLAGGAIAGLTLSPGLYHWGSAVTIDDDITIAGGATDTWIFQVLGTVDIAANKRMTLSSGALAENIVWVATGAVAAGAGSHFEGVILGKTGITLKTGATANSRLLAQTLVALQKATVTT